MIFFLFIKQMSDGAHFLRDVNEEILEIQRQLDDVKELLDDGRLFDL